MSFPRPNIKGLLGQIPRIGFLPREAHSKPEERFVVIAYDRFKLIGQIHCAISFHGTRDDTMGLRRQSLDLSEAICAHCGVVTSTTRKPRFQSVIAGWLPKNMRLAERQAGPPKSKA